LEEYESPGSDQIPAELIQAGRPEIHKFINSNWSKEELRDQWKRSEKNVPIYKKRNKAEFLIIMGYHSYELHTFFLFLFI
jgi:hypothetical protein